VYDRTIGILISTRIRLGRQRDQPVRMHCTTADPEYVLPLCLDDILVLDNDSVPFVGAEWSNVACRNGRLGVSWCEKRELLWSQRRPRSENFSAMQLTWSKAFMVLNTNRRCHTRVNISKSYVVSGINDTSPLPDLHSVSVFGWQLNFRNPAGYSLSQRQTAK
jgi:hypothetical protein